MICAATPEPVYSSSVTPLFPVTDDIAGLRTLLVNLYFIGDPAHDWVLLDTGMPLSAQLILSSAAERYGASSRPSSIILTHGHFDHVGAVRELADLWDVPVYVHPLELPYVTGRSRYPPPDPTVGGGLMARSAFLYPRGPIDLGARAHALTSDQSVPGLRGWQWIHTPGHSPGHISLWRESDRCLLAGDAFVTTRQESMTSALTQKPIEVHGPPKYYTPDWTAAWTSVRHLASLNPQIAATGHGLPMSGDDLRQGLRNLLEHFSDLAIPARGRYVDHPATFNQSGVVSIPPPVFDPVMYGALAAVALTTAAATSAFVHTRRE